MYNNINRIWIIEVIYEENKKIMLLCWVYNQNGSKYGQV